jgi:alkanesulfonate monooxygenase SsuD/methylene tetrahydromethanopterin reductase-like flavin-dependent oxidoreductase (luciferase family)
VKLGVVLEASTIEGLVAQALAAEVVGIEIAWIESEPDADTALIGAAAVAARTDVIRLAACVKAGGHPLEIAEAAAVADNCSQGRLILVLEDPTGDAELFAETVDVVLAATAPRPFRHAGPRWRIPSNLPENDQHEEQIIVTPQVVQVELPVWLCGPAAAAVARGRALSHVSNEDEGLDSAQRAWAATDSELGLAAIRSRRPAVRLLDAGADGGFDAEEVVARLRAEQRAWGMDVAVLRLPRALDDAARARAAHGLAQRVRPRVTMHELPAGIERHWQETII